MIKPIVLKTYMKKRKKVYEISYKKEIIFSSANVKEITKFAQKKIDEGYYLRYVPQYKGRI